MESDFFMHRIKKNIYGSDSGFTLIELLVAIAAFSILSVGIVMIFDSFQRGYTTQQITSDTIQKARGALSYMSMDIKAAGLDPVGSVKPTGGALEGDVSNFTIRTATDKTLTFDMDIPDAAGDFNGTLEIAAERITYRFDNNRLMKFVGNPPAIGVTPVANEVIPEVDSAASSFQYFMADGADVGSDEDPVPLVGGAVAAANIERIRSIGITLVVSENAGRDGLVTRTFTSRVLCKNHVLNSLR